MDVWSNSVLRHCIAEGQRRVHPFHRRAVTEWSDRGLREVNVPDVSTTVAWARSEAERLRRVGTTTASQDISRGEMAAATEFLRLNAGPKSEFYLEANSSTNGTYPGLAVVTVAKILDGWAAFVEAGMSEQPLEQRGRFDASTDLMEQVQTLLDDRRVHPAAPVVLAGAALEEFLRGLLAVTTAEIKGKPGLDAYAKALREADVLNTQDMKDITSWAGLRNAAAHGEFDQVGIENARIMAQAVNLFMRQKS